MFEAIIRSPQGTYTLQYTEKGFWANPDGSENREFTWFKNLNGEYETVPTAWIQ